MSTTSIRARYDGASGTGVDLLVPLADGQTRGVHVEPGHQLPTEIDGEPVPAAYRDSLLEQDGWSEVRQDTSGKGRSAEKPEQERRDTTTPADAGKGS